MKPRCYRLAALAVVLATAPAALAQISVVNINDSGPGSLREAVIEANTNPGLDEITFDIPGVIPHVIETTQALPILTDPVTIDATTQPGYDGAPVVEVTGSESKGFWFHTGSEGSRLQGLAVGGYETAFYIEEVDDITVLGSWAGFTALGAPNGVGTGVFIQESDGTQIGGEAPGEGVVIGNGHEGIRLESATNVEVINTRLGTDPSGLMPAPFLTSGSDPAVVAAEGSTVTLRGTEPGACLLSAADYGLLLQLDAFATVDGCFVGLGADGTTVLGNLADGIRVEATAGGADIRNSVISGNGGEGIRARGPGPEVTLTDNVVGMNADETEAAPNSRGLVILDTPDVSIRGGTFAGNAGVNVLLYGPGTTGTDVKGALISAADTDGDGNPEPVTNGGPGLLIREGAHDNQIGGTEEGEGNVFGVGEEAPGVAIVGESTGNTVLTDEAIAVILRASIQILFDLCDDGTDTPPTCGANDDRRSPAIIEVRPGKGQTVEEGQTVEVDYSYDDPALDPEDILMKIDLYLSGIPPESSASRQPADGGDLYQLVVIGEDTYTAEDYDACGDPPCPKTVTFTLPFPAEAGDLVFATATDADGNTSELSEPVAVPVTNEGTAAPLAFALHGSYPNPFAEAATIRFSLPEATRVRLAVYDLLGREVAVLVDGPRPAGEQAVALDGRGLAGGTYVVRLDAGSVTATRRVTLVR